jgi:hypothetical protein
MKSLTGSESLEEIRTMLETSNELLLTREVLTQFIDRYVRGELSAAQLEEIADQLEMAVEYEDAETRDDIATVLFEASGPVINGPITLEAAGRWKAMLQPQNPWNPDRT